MDGAEKLVLSASAIKSYEQCPRKYYFNYIEKAKKKHWEHFDLGNICHKTLELFHSHYSKNGLSGFNNFSSLMKHCFSEARKEIGASDEILVDAKSMLSAYLKKIRKTGMPDVCGTEIPFSFDLSDKVSVRGVIDRVDKIKEHEYKIVDYKTTKNVKYLDDFQLLVYGIWLAKNYENVDRFKASYVLLKHESTTKDFDFNLIDTKKAEKKIFQCADYITNDKEWVGTPSVLCNWCDFKDICPCNSW